VIKGEREKITVEAVLWWNDSYHEHVLAFTNNIPQRDGGTHLAGLARGADLQVTGYAERAGLARIDRRRLTGTVRSRNTERPIDPAPNSLQGRYLNAKLHSSKPVNWVMPVEQAATVFPAAHPRAFAASVATEKRPSAQRTPAAREGICGTAREAERPAAPARTRKHWT
jgi:hypothetical protein